MTNAIQRCPRALHVSLARLLVSAMLRDATLRTAPHRVATTGEQRASGLFNTLRHKLFPIRSHTVTKHLRNWLVKIFETSCERVVSVVYVVNKYLEISSTLSRERS